MKPVERLELRDLTPADVDAAVALATAQGWRDRRRFYDLVLKTSTSRARVGTVHGRIVATGIATANGAVGWLGGIVVDARFRERGYGRAMTENLIELLRAAGCSTVSLEATNAGRPMYERMGFRLATHYHQLEAGHLDAAPSPPAGARVRKLETVDLPAVLELDRAATAEDRSAPLTVLAEWESGGWVLEDAAVGDAGGGPGDAPLRGALRGFLLPAERSYGAIVAPGFEDGLFLLDLHRTLVPVDGHARAGIPAEHMAAVHELEARGWVETWQAPRMLLGADVPWRPEWIWGQINSAMG
jgi:ribosomal protein S18 acetylase RimI-like enzyme